MKKHLFLIIALLVGNFTFAQEIIKIENPFASTWKEGWVGNQDATNMSPFEDATYVMAPRQIDPDVSGTITKIKFCHAEYDIYNTTSYTIKIYEGIDLQLFNESLSLYELSSCGTEVYSQDYTATEQGWQTVELDTPYSIPDGDFWIGVKMNGDGMIVIGDANNAVEGQYYYTEMYQYNLYWKPPYFFNSNYDYLLFSCALAIYVEDDNNVGETAMANVNVYPNPAANFVNIKADGMEKITLMDALGRKINETKVSDDNFTLDINGYNSGIYFLNIETINGSCIKKLSILGKAK